MCDSGAVRDSGDRFDNSNAIHVSGAMRDSVTACTVLCVTVEQ